jgi:hypothetical protein
MSNYSMYIAMISSILWFFRGENTIGVSLNSSSHYSSSSSSEIPNRAGSPNAAIWSFDESYPPSSYSSSASFSASSSASLYS